MFHNLNILNFKKLVTQRIALLMFMYHTGILPNPINNLFSINSKKHNYYTRQINDLQINTVSGFGTTFQGKFKLMPYACYKNLAKTYLQNNDIPQRIR